MDASSGQVKLHALVDATATGAIPAQVRAQVKDTASLDDGVLSLRSSQGQHMQQLAREMRLLEPQVMSTLDKFHASLTEM
jgi:hypothetical protein